MKKYLYIAAIAAVIFYISRKNREDEQNETGYSGATGFSGPYVTDRPTAGSGPAVVPDPNPRYEDGANNRGNGAVENRYSLIV